MGKKGVEQEKCLTDEQKPNQELNNVTLAAKNTRGIKIARGLAARWPWKRRKEMMRRSRKGEEKVA